MSPTDGHCLLHSLITSYHSQAPLLHRLSLESIKMSIRGEIKENLDDYLAFGFSMASLSQQVNAYIVHRDYNSDFVDLVPLILARIYGIEIVILDTSSTGKVTEHVICPRYQSIFSITVQRRGDHYNGIVPITKEITSTPLAVQMTAGVPSYPMLEDDPLPSPWSLDPLPPVTPVLLSHLDIVPCPKCSDALPSCNWSREKLMMIKNATSCHIDRSLRKNLLHLGIWGQHHRCEDNPGWGSLFSMPKPIIFHVTHPFIRNVNSCTMHNLITVPKSDVKDSLHFSEFAHILSNDIMTPSSLVERDEPIPLILTQ